MLENLNLLERRTSLSSARISFIRCLTTTNFRIISEKISEKIPVSERTIENDLAVLKKYGFIRRVGSRKEGHWEIIVSHRD